MCKDITSEAQTVRHNVESILRETRYKHITLQIEYKGCEENNELIFSRTLLKALIKI